MGNVIIVSGFHQLGDLVVRMSDGVIFISQYGSIADDVYHNVFDEGSKLRLHHRGASVTISLSGGDQTKSYQNNPLYGAFDFGGGDKTTNESSFSDQQGNELEITQSLRENSLYGVLVYYQQKFGYRDYAKGGILFALCWPLANFIQQFYSLSSSSLNIVLTGSLVLFLSVLFLLSSFIVFYPVMLAVSVGFVIGVPINTVLLDNPIGLTAGGIYHFIFSLGVVLYYMQIKYMH
jgi:hypothetical protein